MEIEEVDNLMYRVLGTISIKSTANSDSFDDVEIVEGIENNSKKCPRIVFDKMEIKYNSTILYELYFYARDSEEMTYVLNQFVKIRDNAIPGFDEFLTMGPYHVINWSLEKLEKKKDHWFGLVKLSNLDFTGWREEKLSKIKGNK